MNTIPDFTSDFLMKNIISLNTESDELLSEEMDQSIQLLDCVGKGGSSIVYKAYHSLIETEVVVKLCEPFDKWMCMEFKTEAKNAYDFLLLNEQKKCYNYPITYGYYHTCLFFTPTESQEILSYLSNHSEEIGSKKDAFLVYCTTPSDIVLPQKLIDYVSFSFNPQFIVESTQFLPKCRNMKALLQYASGCKKLSTISWETSDAVYNYLKDETEQVVCSVFLMQQYLEGVSLDQYQMEHQTLSDSLFFEFVYSKLVSIALLGKLYGDVHLDNVMAVKSNVPRVYLHKGDHYVIPGEMIYHIDSAIIDDKYSSKKVGKHLFTIANSIFTNEQKEWIDTYVKGDAVDVLDQLFIWMKKYKKCLVLDEEDSNIYFVRTRNYKLVDADI